MIRGGWGIFDNKTQDMIIPAKGKNVRDIWKSAK
jgi:hypothetical protein